MKATLMSLVVFLASSSAFADKLVSCVTTAKNPQNVLQFSISNASSARLTSSLTYTSNNQSELIFQSDVAQYKKSDLELYVLADVNEATPSLRLVALGLNGKSYIGVVSEYNAAGSVVKNIAVNCKVN